MSPRAWIAILITMAYISSNASGSVIFGQPVGGPVTLHSGTLAIDLNGDGSADLTISDSPARNPDGSIWGSAQEIFPVIGTGVYLYQRETGGYAAALLPGQQVGPQASGAYIYGVPGLATVAIIHGPSQYSTNGVGDPGWIDGRHQFLGTDTVSGSDHHFGWIEVSLADSGVPTTDQPWYDLTIYDWANETQANVPITVPEPSSPETFGLLAFGAGLVRRRCAPVR